MGSACFCGKTDPVLFDQLGGEQGLETIVRFFYEKVLKDDRINLMFEETDMQILSNHVELFMSSVLGGPCNYEGKNIRVAHCLVNNGKYPYKIHFKAVVENMVNTLSELNISQKVTKDVRTFILSMESDVRGYDEDIKVDQKKHNISSIKEGNCEEETRMQSLLKNVVNPYASTPDEKLHEADIGGSVSSPQVSSRKDLPTFEHILPKDGALDEDVHLSSSGSITSDMQKDLKALVVKKALEGQDNLPGVALYN